MESLIIPLILLFLVAPITLSIVALAQVSSLRKELRQGRDPLRNPVDTSVHPKQTIKPAKPLPKKSPVPKKVRQEENVLSPSVRTKKPAPGLEFLMGGKVAAFAGIAILVTGIALLVGYAIQHSWIGAGTRVILGLLAGGMLVGFGHFVERKNEKLRLFARVLTGGGSALFYFTVFAAYGMYHLIGAFTAGAGLFASALAVFGLAMVYQSQSVGVLGVLGAFVTPFLIGGEMDAGIFPLVYVALINVPVILLGVRRKWQVLYNLAFMCTVIHYSVWLDWVGCKEWWVGLTFAVLFFAEYAALGLLKLRSEQKVTGRTADIIRLLFASLLLLCAIYWLLSDADMKEWVGFSFLLLALIHVALAWFAFKVLSRFNGEILAFLSGGLIFATLALPAQLDGEWVSIGWAIEGVVLAWFATRVRSRVLQSAAFLLGLIGIMKALLFDVSLYDCTPALFLNARFIVGLLSAALLGIQGKIAGHFPDKGTSSNWQDVMWWTGVLAAVVIFFADTFWTLGLNDAFSWLITSLILLAAGAALVLFAPPKSSVTILGSLLLLLVPAKILLLDTCFVLEFRLYRLPSFYNAVIWTQLVIVGIIILLFRAPTFSRKTRLIMPAPMFARILNILSLVAGIGVISIEILQQKRSWADMAVTIFWAVSALALILFGMKQKSSAHRYFGLALFGITTLKVLLVDSSELKGLERIAAFIGTGILLLALSFAYQKVSSWFLTERNAP